MENTCIFCSAVIPEGRQICCYCEKEKAENAEKQISYQQKRKSIQRKTDGNSRLLVSK